MLQTELDAANATFDSHKAACRFCSKYIPAQTRTLACMCYTGMRHFKTVLDLREKLARRKKDGGR